MSTAWTEGRWTRGADALRGWVGCAMLAACAPAYTLSFTSFYHAKEAVLYAGLAVAALLVAARRRFEWSGVRLFAPLWLLVAFCLAMHIGGGAAAVPTATLEEAGRWTMVLMAPALYSDLLRSARWRRRFRRSFVASVMAVAAMAWWQYVNPGTWWFPEFPGNTQAVYSAMANQDALGICMAAAVPMLLYGAAQDRRRTAVHLGMLAVTLLVLVLSASRGAWVAATVGAAVALARTPGRARMAWVVVASVVVVSPLVYVAREDLGERMLGLARLDDTGVRARLWFWDGALRMVRDHPFIGVGLGNYAFHAPEYQGEALHAPGGERHFHNELDTVYAHNDPLQLLAETGIVGGLLGAWMLWRVVRRMGIRAPEPGLLAALGTASLTFFAMHCAPFALWAAMSTMAVGSERRRAKTGRVAARVAAIVLPATAWGVAAFLSWAVLWPSVLLARADTAARDGGPALELYALTVLHPWPNAWAHRNFGVALSKEGYYEEAADQFTEALQGLDSGVVYLALGALAEWHGDQEEAATRLGEALYRIPGSEDAWRRLVRVSPMDAREGLLAEAARWLDASALASIGVTDAAGADIGED